MEKWLGVLVVLFVLALNFLARKRSCGSCHSCGSICQGSKSAPESMNGPEDAVQAATAAHHDA